MGEGRGPRGELRVGAYCLCGASLRGTMRGYPREDEELLARFAEEWARDHEGDGHGETDARGAARGRTKAERRK